MVYFEIILCQSQKKDFITIRLKSVVEFLQGDCLLPLIFNLCVNTFIKSIKSEKGGCLGYVLGKVLSPRR